MHGRASRDRGPFQFFGSLGDTSTILVFIGAKLILTYFHELFNEVPKISTPVSLGVITGILMISTIASAIKSKSDSTAREHAGRITGGKVHEEETS